MKATPAFRYQNRHENQLENQPQKPPRLCFVSETNSQTHNNHNPYTDTSTRSSTRTHKNKHTQSYTAMKHDNTVNLLKFTVASIEKASVCFPKLIPLTRRIRDRNKTSYKEEGATEKHVS